MRPAATAATLIWALAAARAHGDHGHAQGGEDHSQEGYIRQHMSSEHHIDTFDLASFFQLHDLDHDGFWDRGEIEAVYGVHHDWNPKDKDMQKIKEKADMVVARVLQLLDADRDNRISKAEFERAGFEGLPDLSKELGAEGHHYDVESEFFLHHEELYHSTPDTQTDEAYTHPEDDEHFANHEHIEAEEDRRERAFQGLPLEGEAGEKAGHDHDHPAPPSSDETKAESDVKVEYAGDTPPPAGEAPPASDPVLDAAHPHDDQAVFEEPQQTRQKPKIVRQPPPEKQNPTERFKTARGESQEKAQWGEGDDGFKRPKTPADRMRKNVPYKYKFKRNWGDF
ncbi:hypothetical protein EXIGLDRAFT_732473 [Exidia glandulosa HHB12029]|uniref:EF-hand domain-containing protein n=1 Tax=Exidia glandulosa HHB12029 TaxID=1314781 RepID=A0A165BHW3_EXIGL|nr:hypothetical protein EXIGLDRAFT_732473 [Exidia glandulosa HHB12029]